jgi:hypothetical protein
MKKNVDPAVRDYMAKIGAKGGKASRGKKKVRSPEHYRKLVEIRRRKKERMR